MPRKTPANVKDEIVRLKMEWLSLREIADIITTNFDYPIIHSTVASVLRWNALNDYVQQENITWENARHYWHKTKLEDWSKISVFIKNPIEENKMEKLHSNMIDDVKKHAPIYPVIKRTISKDWHLLVVDPADIHIGKLASAFETGEDYNNQIAVKRVMEWVQWLLDKSAPYNIDKILFVGWNDILHIDTPKRQTTSGTPQDTDGMWYDNYMIAKKLYVDVLELLIAVANVEFVFNPSNHDFMTGFMLCQTIQAHFSNNKNIKFNCDMSHRKYYQYGKNMIGTTHWDWAKQNDLPLLMATEAAIMRSESKHRYIYWHHIHHKVAKDYIWATFESLRSPSGTDSRHHRNGYTGSPAAVEGFLHHKERWQVAKFTHLF